MTYLHAGQFESSYKHFRWTYCFSSGKARTVSYEVTRKRNRRIATDAHDSTNNKYILRQNIPKQEAVETDGAFLVKSEPQSTLGGVAEVLKRFKTSSVSFSMSSNQPCFEKLLFFASSKWLSSLFSASVEGVLSVQKRWPWWNNAQKFQIPSSAYMSTHIVTSLESHVCPNCAAVKKSDQSFIHRVVAADNYYGSSTGRFDTKMIEADEERSFLEKNIDEEQILFGKVPAFVRVPLNHNEPTPCSTSGRPYCTECNNCVGDEMAYMQ